MDELQILKQIAIRTGLHNKLKFTTTSLSMITNLSQQSASRRLISLEKSGYIDRHPTSKGIEVGLTDKGIHFLKEEYYTLKSIIEKKQLRIKAKIISGLGEGKYYIQKKGYQKQFSEKLGINPYHGTLNLEIVNSDISKIKSVPSISINGFNDYDRSYGSITCYPCIVKEITSYAIVPERSSHPGDVIEIISEVNFRKKYNLKDSDIIEVLV